MNIDKIKRVSIKLTKSTALFLLIAIIIATIYIILKEYIQSKFSLNIDPFIIGGVIGEYSKQIKNKIEKWNY